MRLERARFRSIGPFVGDFDLDLRGRSGIIGILAPNGTGKTFTLEASVFGACYRDMPTQGSLVDRALARDTFEESTVVYGRRWRLRHLIDAVSRKSKALVLGEDDKPAYDGDGIPQFKAWAAKNLPDRDVVEVTTFAVQKRGGFIELGSAARIDVILKAIHLARIERAAARARKYEAETLAKLKAVRQRIEDARAGAPEVAAVEAELGAELLAAVLADEELGAARARVVWLEEQERARAEFERQAAAARATAEALDRELAAARERGAHIARRLIEADPVAAEHRAATDQALVDGTRAGIAWIEAEERALQERRAAASTARATRERLAAELAAARTGRGEAEERAAEIRDLVERSAEIRRAELVANAATAEIATAGPREREAAAGERRCADALRDYDRRLESLQRRLERATEAAAGRAAVEVAEQSMPGLIERHAQAVSAVARLENQITTLRADQMNEAHVRISILDGGLERVEQAGDIEIARRIATDARFRNRTAAEHVHEIPSKIAESEAEQRAAAEALKVADRVLADAKTAAHRRAVVEQAEAERDAVHQELREVEGIRETCAREGARAALTGGILRLRIGYLRGKLLEVSARAALAGDLAGADARLEERQRAADAAREALERLERDVALAPAPEELPPARDIEPQRNALAALEDAARRSAAEVAAVAAARRELEPQAVEARARVEKLEADRAALPPVPEVGAPVDLGLARAEIEKLESVAKGHTAAVAREEQRLEQARAADARAATLDAERLELEAELADWTRLALDLGRDGIQSAEVDSAGPELTELTNDLLHECHGPRYTVSIETKRATADGKGETDECRVMVIDTVAGSEKEAKQHSGGEGVIIGEAISLALTMVACRRAGLDGVTLIRDESGAALDPENARVYVAMLRRAAKFVNADKVLLVSHLPAVHALCDSTITIPSQGLPANDTTGAAA